MAEQRYLAVFLHDGESGPDRLVVRDAFGVHAFRYACDFMGHVQFPFLHHLEIPDDVDCGMRCYQSQLVQFLVLEFRQVCGPALSRFPVR